MNIVPSESANSYLGAPLSFEQEHIWQKKSSPNIPPMGLRLSGVLDIPLLAKALEQTVVRHEILRTGFELRSGAPQQVVWRQVRVEFPLTDLAALPAHERVVRAQCLIRAEAERSFDLASPPLMRAGLLRFTHIEHVLFFTMHHIVSDLWSMRLFLRELTESYNAYREHREPRLAPLRIQYCDYAIWQRSWLCGPILDEHLEYWRSRLQGVVQLPLPTDFTPPTARSNDGGVMSRSIPQPLAKCISELAKRQRVTLFMTLLCAFQVLLARYSGQDDVVVSSLTANRGQSEVEPLIGVFANRLAFRTSLSGNPTFGEALARVRDVCLQAYEHRALSLWKVVELTPELEANASATLLFALQDVPSEPVTLKDIAIDGFECTGISMFEKTGMITTGRYDQSWEIWKEQDGSLRMVVSYRTDLFAPLGVDKILRDYAHVLETIVANPRSRVMDVEFDTSNVL